MYQVRTLDKGLHFQNVLRTVSTLPRPLYYTEDSKLYAVHFMTISPRVQGVIQVFIYKHTYLPPAGG